MRTVEKDKWCHGESEYKGDRVRTELERKHRRRFFFFLIQESSSRGRAVGEVKRVLIMGSDGVR